MDKYESFSIPSKTISVLAWWKLHCKILPILANIARSVLAIPASSAKSERVFSTGGNIVTVKRTRMRPKKVEQLIVIKENKSKVEDFKRRTTYEIDRTGQNGFLDIDIEEIVKETEDSSDEEDLFADTDSDNNSSREEYDTDFSESDEEDEHNIAITLDDE